MRCDAKVCQMTAKELEEDDCVFKAVRATLIKEALTSNSTAKAGNTIVTADLAFELVVISEFLVCGNS